MNFRALAIFLALFNVAQAFTSTPHVAGIPKLKLQGSPIRNAASNKRTLVLQAIPTEALTWAGVSVVGGVLGTPVVIKATKQVNGWYSTIKKPSWCPPNGVFAPVWTVLYAMIGYSGFLAKEAMGVAPWRFGFASEPTMALALAHYILNLTWAPVFFGLHWIAAAAVINVGLVASLVEVMGKFWPVSQKAALLLVPYAAWVVFATFLNIEILRLNRGKPESKGISAL